MQITRTTAGKWRLDFRIGDHLPGVSKLVRHRETYATLPAATARAAIIELGQYTPRPAPIASPAPSQPRPLTVDDAMTRWQEHCNTLKRHSPNYKWRIYFARRCLVGFFKSTPANAIDRPAFDAYVAHRTAQGVKLYTIKKEHSILTAALTWCAGRGLLARNDVAGYWHGVRIPEKAIAVPMPADLRAVMHALPHADARRLFWFLLATGCRITESIELRGEDLHQDCIHFHRGVKGGVERHAPRPPGLELPATGLAFTCNGNPWRRDVYLHVLWRACALAGVSRFSPHALRHAHATYALVDGEPLYSLMSACGWRSFGIVQRYVSIAQRYKNCAGFLADFVGKRQQMDT